MSLTRLQNGADTYYNTIK